jgi:hypothetical protein
VVDPWCQLTCKCADSPPVLLQSFLMLRGRLEGSLKEQLCTAVYLKDMLHMQRGTHQNNLKLKLLIRELVFTLGGRRPACATAASSTSWSHCCG